MPRLSRELVKQVAVRSNHREEQVVFARWRVPGGQIRGLDAAELLLANEHVNKPQGDFRAGESEMLEVECGILAGANDLNLREPPAADEAFE